MNKCRFFVALVAFSGILAGNFAATGVLNQKMANDFTSETFHNCGNLTVGGYYDVQTTIYLRDVQGVLWATKVVYKAKTIYLRGYMLDIDGDRNFTTSECTHVRPTGVVDRVRYTTWPYIEARLVALPVNARDWLQHVSMTPKARIWNSNLNPQGDIRIYGPSVSAKWDNVSNGQVIWCNPSTGTWQLTDFPQITW